MPDMTKPYAYIEGEIDRLKYAEQNASLEANRQSLIAEVHMLNRMKLESALDQQKEADERNNND